MRSGYAAGVLCVLMLVLSPIGCDKEAPPPDVEPRDAPDFSSRRTAPGDTDGAADYGSAGDRAELPPGHPPLGAGEGLPPGHPPLTAALPTGRELTFTPPESWEETPPRNTMIRRSFALPRVEDDTEDAVLEITHFPEMGHVTFKMQADRWANSFEQPDGRPSTEVATHREIEGGKFPTMMLDVSGRFQLTTMMGQPQGEPKENYRMLAAEIRSDQGPWFVKLTGPGKTIEHWEEAFVEFVREAK